MVSLLLLLSPIAVFFVQINAEQTCLSVSSDVFSSEKRQNDTCQSVITTYFPPEEESLPKSCARLPKFGYTQAIGPAINGLCPAFSECFFENDQNQCYFEDCDNLPSWATEKHAIGPAGYLQECQLGARCYFNGQMNECYSKFACSVQEDPANECLPKAKEPPCASLPLSGVAAALGPAINSECPPMTTCFHSKGSNQCFADPCPFLSESITEDQVVGPAGFLHECQSGAKCFFDGESNQCYFESNRAESSSDFSMIDFPCADLPSSATSTPIGPTINGMCPPFSACFNDGKEKQCYFNPCEKRPESITQEMAIGPATFEQKCPPESTCYYDGEWNQCFAKEQL
ncbi:unnamed protein product, partial [Mesorhabditis belari]|uniref:Uncharacterized protein n=1 Tax=Mesorhabditis belari TaxID=2138241 RepID=A0AAF3F0Y2_9BILA